MSGVVQPTLHSSQLLDCSGALLIDKGDGVSSFGVIEHLQKELRSRYGLRRSELPKLGHGGTLDPFATGLLPVCVGKGVKLARYFLGSVKSYEGIIRFGETTLPGDPTAPVTEQSDVLPESLEKLQAVARSLTLQPYLQTPPMFSAKKKDGKPLYELARAGIEVEREAKLCHLYKFEILSYADRRAAFRVTCSSGTYIRTLAQDFAAFFGTVAMLDSLRRTGIGELGIATAWTLDRIRATTREGRSWDTLECWIPFDRLLDGQARAEATGEETTALIQGRQNVLFNILKRTQEASVGPWLGGASAEVQDDPCVAIYHQTQLVAVARRAQGVWGLERVFARS